MCDLDVWQYVARLGVRPRPSPSDPFFSDGDAVCAMRTCTYLTQEDEEELLHPDHREFPCPAPGCGAAFTQLIEFETHYNSAHRHVCESCGASAPSAHLLSLHVSENHDSFFAVAKAKRPGYECWLERCPKKFWTAEERGRHCVGVHQFNPQDFKFTRDDEESPSGTEGSSRGGGPRSMEVDDDDNEPGLPHPERPVMQEEEEVQLRRHSNRGGVAVSRRGSAASSQQSSPSKPSRRVEPATQDSPSSRVSQHRAQRSPPTSGRRRPHSVYSLLPQPVSPTRTKKVYQASSTSPPLSGHRRFSLASTISASAAREAELGRVRDDSSRGGGCDDSKSVPVSPEKRPSLSLARMGERLRSGNRNSFSTFDVRNDPSSSSGSAVSKGGNGNGGGRASRIPVLNRSLSSKVPKEIRFGAGAQRTFAPASSGWHNRVRGDRADSVAAADPYADFEEQMRHALA